ncbi:MAG: GntR family transcriptional regulator [Clostridia bacterium]|nr:GntR family transcriptional regulator [Clostridia bacterium]
MSVLYNCINRNSTPRTERRASLITIDYKSRVPIYDQISAGIIRLRSVGVLSGGDKLPSVRSMALSLGINPNTVQKAYSTLEAQGVIYSVSGKGSFVSEDMAAANAILASAKHDFLGAVSNAKSVGLKREDLEEIINKVYKGGEEND